MASEPIVRISIMRCYATQFDTLRHMMLEVETALGPGIERLVRTTHHELCDDVALRTDGRIAGAN